MDKPIGLWKCRACGIVWKGEQVHTDPTYTVTVWTCGDFFCGGTCDQIPAEIVIQNNIKPNYEEF
jgi:hypothetical protein